LYQCNIQVSTCSKCGGLGKIITDQCRRCDGSGQVQSKQTMEVEIPPGVNDGDTMQIQGQGNFDKKRLALAGFQWIFLLPTMFWPDYTVNCGMNSSWVCQFDKRKI